MNKKIENFEDVTDVALDSIFSGIWKGMGFLIWIFIISLPMAFISVGIKTGDLWAFLMGVIGIYYLFFDSNNE